MNTHTAPRILIVEDERHIAEGLKLNLTLQGYAVAVAGDGVSALERWRSWHPDLIVLDIMLPGIDGLSVLQNIRLEDEQLPILILSAKAAPDDRIKGLAFGVDDYLTKPFNLEEFLLRIERLIKRSRWNHQNGRLERDSRLALPERFVFGENHIDFTTGTARCRSGVVTLTEQELKLLKLFVINRDRPLSRQKILEIGWGYVGGMTTRTVDNFIVRFRKYFEVNPKDPVHFKSVRGVGYKFVSEPGVDPDGA
jgi:two-component system, OmpR family, alkaline phosphatase synthesis response regulator PhoP